MLGTILSGDRIRLRAPALEDLPVFARWLADPAVTRYLLRRYPPSPAQEARWFESMATSEKDLVWAVVLDAFFGGEWHDEWLGEILRPDRSGPDRPGSAR